MCGVRCVYGACTCVLCMHVCLYEGMRACMRAWTHVCLRACVHARMRAHAQGACARASVRAPITGWVCVCVFVELFVMYTCTIDKLKYVHIQ